MLSLSKRRNRILAFVLATGIPLIVASSLAIARLYSGQQAALEDTLRARAHALLTTVDYELTTEAAILHNLARAPSLRGGNLDAFFDEAVLAIESHPRWFAVVVDDPSGSTQLLNTRRGRAWQGPTREAESVTEAVRTRGVVFGPALPNADGVLNFRIRMPVIVDGDVKYVLTAALTPQSIGDALYHPERRDNWIATVLDSEKTIVGITLQPERTIGLKSALVDQASEGTIGVGVGVLGERRAYLFAQSPTTKWWAGAVMPVDVLYGPLRSAALDIGVLALIAGAITLGLTLFLARRVEEEAQRTEAGRTENLERSVHVASSALRAAEVASAEKSYFLAAVSHDLRQPLQVVQSAVHLLSRDVPPSSARLIQHIEAAVRSSSALLNALLDITRIESGSIRPNRQVVSLAALISTAATEVRSDAQSKGIDLRYVPSEGAVRTDPVLLASILRNFLTNAVRYTRKGRVLLGCRRRGGFVRIEVWDTGIGIPESERENIFKAFRQVANDERDRHKGYGLGLAVVEKLAALLGHPIGVRSTPGRGSVFWIEVPSTTARAAGDDSGAARAPSRRTHVLIVEDDEVQASTLAATLDEWGVRSSVAAGLTEALERVRQHRPDLMLVDFRLRGHDGLKVIHEVRAAIGPVPAIMVSGEIALKEPLSRLDIPLLVKPYTPEQLLAAVNARVLADA
jgi:signal transduction histidine kinase